LRVERCLFAKGNNKQTRKSFTTRIYKPPVWSIIRLFFVGIIFLLILLLFVIFDIWCVDEEQSETLVACTGQYGLRPLSFLALLLFRFSFLILFLFLARYCGTLKYRSGEIWWESVDGIVEEKSEMVWLKWSTTCNLEASSCAGNRIVKCPHQTSCHS